MQLHVELMFVVSFALHSGRSAPFPPSAAVSFGPGPVPQFTIPSEPGARTSPGVFLHRVGHPSIHTCFPGSGL